MLVLKAKKRKEKAKNARKKGKIPAILYGPGIENLKLEVDSQDFEKILRKAGASSVIQLEIDKKKFSVLVQNVQRNPLSDKPIHIDFFQPSLKEEIEAKIPLLFEGEAPAVKQLGGTLVKNFTEIEIKALPQNLPSGIKVDVSLLKTFEDKILVKDLKFPPKVRALRNLEEIVAFVSPPEKIEEELAKPISEEIEKVEVIKKEKPKEEITEK